MAKRKRTDNTMAKRKRTENTMAKRKRTDNTMANRKKQTIQWLKVKGHFFWPLCCLFFSEIRILIIPLVSSNSS